MDDSRGANSGVISEDGRGDAAITCRVLPFVSYVATVFFFSLFLSVSTALVSTKTSNSYHHLQANGKHGAR